MYQAEPLKSDDSCMGQNSGQTMTRPISNCGPLQFAVEDVWFTNQDYWWMMMLSKRQTNYSTMIASLKGVQFLDNCHPQVETGIFKDLSSKY